VGARSDQPSDWTYPSRTRVPVLKPHSAGGAATPERTGNPSGSNQPSGSSFHRGAVARLLVRCNMALAANIKRE
jgi:hypothetical protein